MNQINTCGVFTSCQRVEGRISPLPSVSSSHSKLILDFFPSSSQNVLNKMEDGSLRCLSFSHQPPTPISKYSEVFVKTWQA